MGERNILIALPENKNRRTISKRLRQDGYSVIYKRSGQDVLDYVQQEIPLIIIMGADLPKVSGWEVCKQLKLDRLTKKIGVVLYADERDDNEVILGLEMGADEFITADESIREIIARINALSRRIIIANNHIKVKDIEIDLDEHRVRKDGAPIDLTYIQFKLLYLLASRREDIFSRQEILERVWGKRVYVTNRTVDVHIKRLREKLGEFQYPSEYIQTIHGKGYRFI
ncbi:MAG TPA: response regulator [Bacteroidetes bacterium]|nr:response regulator [Bacteroidota bacterium]